MAWIVLFTAGVLEIVWAVGLNYKGFTRLWPSVATVSAMAASLALLGVAVGTVGTVFAYMALWRVGCIHTPVLRVPHPRRYHRFEASHGDL